MGELYLSLVALWHELGPVTVSRAQSFFMSWKWEGKFVEGVAVQKVVVWRETGREPGGGGEGGGGKGRGQNLAYE